MERKIKGIVAYINKDIVEEFAEYDFSTLVQANLGAAVARFSGIDISGNDNIGVLKLKKDKRTLLTLELPDYVAAARLADKLLALQDKWRKEDE